MVIFASRIRIRLLNPDPLIWLNPDTQTWLNPDPILIRNTGFFMWLWTSTIFIPTFVAAVGELATFCLESGKKGKKFSSFEIVCGFFCFFFSLKALEIYLQRSTRLEQNLFAMNCQLYAGIAQKTPVLKCTISWSLFWPLIWLMVCVQVVLLQKKTFIRVLKIRIQTCIIFVGSRPWRLSWRRSRPSRRCWWSGRGRARPAWSSSPQNSPPSAVCASPQCSGSMPLTNGSGSCYFRHWPSRCQQKTN